MNTNEHATLDATLEALRAIAEHTRLRILLLCAHGELTVSDLTEILDQSQPRLSRHLKLMHEAGVLERHQEGQNAWFRAVTDGPLADLVRTAVDKVAPEDPIHASDLGRLQDVTHTWEVRAQSYFRKHYADWDRLRRRLIDVDKVDAFLTDRFGALGARSLLDIGTGTGHVLRLLGRQIENGVGIDTSRDMLLAARAAIHNEKLPHCQVRQADMTRRLPFEGGAFDAVSIHLVLHYAEDPAAVLAECGRVTSPGGHIVIADFSRHDRRELTRTHGHRWPGFEDREVLDWLDAAGFEAVEADSIGSAATDAPELRFWLARHAVTTH